MCVITRPVQGTFYDMLVAVEAAKQEVTVGEDTLSGLPFEDHFVGIPETPEGLRKAKSKGRIH